MDFGDADAVWLINLKNGVNAPGDNYMLFDNYRVTASSLPVVPAQMEFRGRTGLGWAVLPLFG